MIKLLEATISELEKLNYNLSGFDSLSLAQYWRNENGANC